MGATPGHQDKQEEDSCPEQDGEGFLSFAWIDCI